MDIIISSDKMLTCPPTLSPSLRLASPRLLLLLSHPIGQRIRRTTGAAPFKPSSVKCLPHTETNASQELAMSQRLLTASLLLLLIPFVSPRRRKSASLPHLPPPSFLPSFLQQAHSTLYSLLLHLLLFISASYYVHGLKFSRPCENNTYDESE